MKRPLIYFICLILLANFVTYLPATACTETKKKADTAEIVAVTSCEVAGDGEVTIVATCETMDAQSAEHRSRWATAKTTVKASVAVTKAIARTATVVASSMARAARHAAMALLESAYELV